MSFRSGDLTLRGVLYKPNGKGPFPAVLYNHGSAPGMLNSQPTRAPNFFFQAENDFDLAPSEVFSTAMKEAGKSYQLKFYPPFGKSPKDGHSFAYLGSAIWEADVLGSAALI